MRKNVLDVSRMMGLCGISRFFLTGL